MIKIAVCDDEEKYLYFIQNILNKYPLEVFLFRSGEEILASPIHFDIAILDIDMSGINGIETAKRMREFDKSVKIIYLTNYSDYSIFAFAVHAFAYLIKSNDPHEMSLQLGNQLEEAFLYLQEEKGEVLEFHSTEGIIHIEEEKIIYFEYQNRLIHMITKEKIYYLREKITDLAKRMEDRGFAMPHKSFVVNLYHVKSFKGNDILLSENSMIPLSQKKAVVFRRQMNHYLANRMNGGRSGNE